MTKGWSMPKTKALSISYYKIIKKFSKNYFNKNVLHYKVPYINSVD